MRKLPLLLLLVSASALAAPTKQLLGARSAHHELRLQRSVAAADQIAYDVTLIDLDSGKTVLSSQLNGRPGEPLQATATAEGKQIRVRLADTPHFFSATVNVVEGNSIVDEFRTWWQLQPRSNASTAGEAPPPRINASDAYRVGGDVKAPIVIRRVEPIYTEEARHDRISGIVIVEALIDRDGRVKNAVVLKPLPAGLDQAALDAIRQWEFRPGTLNGEPVAVIFNLTINFRLEPPPPPQP